MKNKKMIDKVSMLLHVCITYQLSFSLTETLSKRLGFAASKLFPDLYNAQDYILHILKSIPPLENVKTKVGFDRVLYFLWPRREFVHTLSARGQK